MYNSLANMIKQKYEENTIVQELRNKIRPTSSGSNYTAII